MVCSKRPRTVSAFFIFVTIGILFLSAAVLPAHAQEVGAESNNTTAGAATPKEGQAIPSSCSEVKDDLAGDGGPDYRVVKGSCSIRLESGDTLSNVWFRANGKKVEIKTKGSGWTIRNIAIEGDCGSGSALHLRVDSRNGSGLVHNLWASDFKSGNVIFVGPRHKGKVIIRQSTFVRIAEDAIYASRSGNPLTLPGNHIDGGGGIVGVEQVYVKNVGTGPESGYGVRLGSDGSYVMDSTIVSTSGPAVANTFAGGYHARKHPEAFDGVLVRNVDIITKASGIRFNNHQSGVKSKRAHTAITHLEGVRIDAGPALERNDAGGEPPVVNGNYSRAATDTPPKGAPRSPLRAASGVGGGTGSIGGAVVGPGGLFPFREIVLIAALTATSVVLGLMILIVLLLVILKRKMGL